MTLDDIDLATRDAHVCPAVAAKILGLSRQGVYALVTRGQLAHFKIGERVSIFTPQLREKLGLPPISLATAQ